jgi:two-component system, NarL family, sensor histidine kinase DevS
MHESSQVPAISPAEQGGPGAGARPGHRSRAATAGSPEMMVRLAEDHGRIAEGLNDLVRRLFSAGLALEAALGLIGEHCAAGRIEHAISELDQAIADLRGTLFARGADPPSGSAG